MSQIGAVSPVALPQVPPTAPIPSAKKDNGGDEATETPATKAQESSSSSAVNITA